MCTKNEIDYGVLGPSYQAIVDGINNNEEVAKEIEKREEEIREYRHINEINISDLVNKYNDARQQLVYLRLREKQKGFCTICQVSPPQAVGILVWELQKNRLILVLNIAFYLLGG